MTFFKNVIRQMCQIGSIKIMHFWKRSINVCDMLCTCMIIAISTVDYHLEFVEAENEYKFTHFVNKINIQSFVEIDANFYGP